MNPVRKRITVQREVLLVEIERYCGFTDCMTRNRFGLTKREAATYIGFQCDRCGEWNEDRLAPSEVPEWSEELRRD